MSDKHVKLPRPADNTPILPNEVRLTSVGNVAPHLAYALNLLRPENPESPAHDSILLKAMGLGTKNAITLAEILRRRVPGLHQITKIGSVELKDVWEPTEEGLKTVITTRWVASIGITLSKSPLDTTDPGYQAPLQEEERKTLSEPFIYSRGRGRGGRGRGRGRRGGRGPRRDGEQGQASEQRAAPQGEPAQQQQGQGQVQGEGQGERGGRRGRGRGRGRRGPRGPRRDNNGAPLPVPNAVTLPINPNPSNVDNAPVDGSAPRGRRGGRGGRGRGRGRGRRGSPRNGSGNGNGNGNNGPSQFVSSAAAPSQ